jgi:hypothetical protein
MPSSKTLTQRRPDLTTLRTASARIRLPEMADQSLPVRTTDEFFSDGTSVNLIRGPRAGTSPSCRRTFGTSCGSQPG